jgi:uncharacterized protein (DUF2267 family)
MAMEPQVDLFDTSVRESHEWVEDVMRETGLDQRYALQALRAVLHAIRDEVSVRQSGHLAAEMPTLIRGMYFEGWEPGRPPPTNHSPETFIERVRSQLSGYDRGLDAAQIARAVFRVLERRMPVPAAKIKHALPRELRTWWPTTIAEETVERHSRLVAEERVATYEALHAECGHERGAPMAPHQNRAPGEQHRGGPLPNMM